jgi:hypothetical protein
MKTRFSFIDPGAIMGVVVSLIVLGVGVFAFFTVLVEVKDQANLPSDHNWANMTVGERRMYNAAVNQQGTGNSVFNIIGIVLIIGAIMSIVGLVYNYVR